MLSDKDNHYHIAQIKDKNFFVRFVNKLVCVIDGHGS